MHGHPGQVHYDSKQRFVVGLQNEAIEVVNFIFKANMRSRSSPYP